MDLWDVISPLDLTTFARGLPDEEGNTLNRVIPDREIRGVKTRQTRVTRRNVTAKYRAYNAETPIGQRPIAVDATELTLLPLGQLLVLTEWEQILEDMARMGTEPLDRILETIYDDVEHNVAAIRNRIELARGDFLTDGKFTLTNENKLTVEYDAGLPASHKVVVTTSWTDPSAPILSQEKAWQRIVQKDTRGKAVRYQIEHPDLIDLRAANEEYRSAYWGAATNQPTLDLSQINSVRGRNGLVEIVPYNHHLEVDGIDTPVLDPRNIHLVTDDVAEVQWGTTAESLSLAATNAVDFTMEDAPGIFAVAYKTVNPPTGYSLANATAMPVGGDINGLLVAQVVLEPNWGI